MPREMSDKETINSLIQYAQMLERRFDLLEYLDRQRRFSERAFGPGPRPAGVIDHIRKELIEIEAAPDDLKEWIDVVTLALDGAWRAGHRPDESRAVSAPHGLTINEDFQGHLTDMQDSRPS